MRFRLRCQREPAARWLRVVLGWSVAAVGLVAAVGCIQLPTEPTEPYTPPTPEFITYTGSVFQPQTSETGTLWGPRGIKPIPGARVTIVGGRLDGRATLTDAEGRFAFEAYPYCELESMACAVRRFRVEKAGYETRVLGASDPYRTTNYRNLYYSASEKHIPIGHAWPADPETQRMRRDLPAMDPLWLIVEPASLEAIQLAGSYGSGLVHVRSLEELSAIGHEYCHAHQDWSIDPVVSSFYGPDWLQTPEGLAFVAAWEADWPHPYLELMEILGSRAGNKRPDEEAAGICSYYFYDVWDPSLRTTVGRRYLRDHVPHLYAWAEEWLRWR